MNPKEKAEELMQRFQIASEARFTEKEKLIQQRKVQVCALICVDEILNTDPHDPMYWNQVKREIEEIENPN